VADKVFELLGDYNSDRSVNTADWVVWQKGAILADGDDDGDVVADDDDLDGTDDDLSVYSQNFGNTLTLDEVTVT
jgi:hypothetical protein